jgi:spore germination cell wall hydrolase CwlJ-like protein
MKLQISATANPLDLYSCLMHNRSMRHLLLLAALLPATLQSQIFVSCPIPKSTVKIEIMIDPSQEEKCLATTIYGEGRGETELGQRAVAYTIVNRAVKKTLCQVALAPKQYSIFNDNPFLRMAALSKNIIPKQKNVIDQTSWALAMKVANDVFYGKVIDPTNSATHYLSDKLMHKRGYRYPKWSKKYIQVALIGSHRFFKQNKVSNPKLDQLTIASN